MFKNKIIIGTWSLSGSFGNVDKKEIYNIIDYAIDSGFLEYDLAPNYGFGEIEEIFSDIKRQNPSIIINTKCGNNYNGIKSFKQKDIIDSLKRSLDLLEFINILYLHNPRDEISDMTELISILLEFKKQGLIKNTGISFARNNYFTKKDINQLDFIQDEINILHCNNLTLLKNYDCKIVARSPLASGVLSGNLNRNITFEKKDYRFSWLKGKRLENILFQIDEIKKIIDCDIRRYAKYFVLSNPNIHKVIFGIKSKDHIKELIDDMAIFENSSFTETSEILKLANKNYNLKDINNGY